MIQQMQEECVALADDLMQCRNQWKEAEREWNMQVDELKGELEHAIQEAEHWKNTMQDGGDSQEVSDLKDHLSELEQERSDLQGCLDEALKELEAVDVELQNDQTLNEFRKENERLRQMMEEGDKKVLESLRHMYRWLLERDGEEEDNVHTSPSDANELIAAIRSHLERHPPSDKDLVETRKQVAKLESQLHVYKGDLKAREESTNELRQSLKEAVALLKPLQDAVTKADEDKLSLQQEVEELRAVKFDDRRDASAQKMRNLKDQLRDKEDECDRLQEEVESLEIQLSRAKVAAAKSLVTPQKSPGFESPTLIRAREELRAKRESESALKQMLADAHDRFNSLQSHNKEVSEMNYELHRRLVDAEDVGQLAQTQSIEFDELKQRQEQAQQEILARDDQIQGLQNELKVLKGDLAVRDAELRQLEKELADAKTVNTRGAASYEHAKIQIHELESKQKALTDDLKAKKESEKKLNKSLKEALSLLKPLQNHLEEAETEKRELWDELVNLRIRTGRRSVSATDSPAQTPELANTQGLEQTITHLERENSQLHDALEEMSQALSQSHMSAMAMTPASKAESKIREELVELKSRCEVTQNRLEDSRVENHSLSEALKKRENEERSMVNEIRLLHEQLAQTQAALESAKFASVDALATTTAEEKKEEVPQNGFNHYENYSQRPRYQGKPKGVQGQSSMYIRRFT
jgi:chromosome segregation ATPase